MLTRFLALALLAIASNVAPAQVFLYVGALLSDDVRKCDFDTGSQSGSLNGANFGLVESLAQNAAGEILVADYGLIQRFNANTGAYVNSFSPMTSGATAMALSPTGELFFAVHSQVGPTIFRANPTTGMVLGSFNTPAGTTRDIYSQRFAANGELYVLNSGLTAQQKLIHRFNYATGTLVGSISLPANDGYYGMAIAPNGDVLVSSFVNDSILRYSATGASLGVFASGGLIDNPYGMEFGPDGNLYVANYSGDNVLRFDGLTGSLLGIAASGNGLDGPSTIMFTAVPEPSSITLLSMSVIGTALAKRRRG